MCVQFDSDNVRGGDTEVVRGVRPDVVAGCDKLEFTSVKSNDIARKSAGGEGQ